MTAHHVDSIERGIPPVALRPDIACRPDDNTSFYLDDHDGPEQRRVVRLCFRCPHQEDCLRWALQTKQRYGIWGGYTAGQRADLLRRLALKTTTHTAS